MYKKIDEKIMKQAKKSIVQPSENYDARVNLVLDCLPETRKKVIKISTWQRAAAAFAVCLLSISSGVLAANYVLSERLQNMPDIEVAGFSLNEQNTKANADSYSRTLTEEEQERLAKLQDAYSMEGEFPVSQLQTVVGLDDIEIDRMCYVITDSLFYFPERELKDEELLQYIDFCTKRDYSIAKTWQESTEAQVESRSALDASKAVQKGIDLVQRVFGEDVSGHEYSLEMLNGTGDVLNGLFTLDFKRDGAVAYKVSVDECGDFGVQAVYMVDGELEVQINEDEYINKYKVARELLMETFDIKESEIKDTLVTYEKTNNSMLLNARVTYGFQTTDNAGYCVMFDANDWSCMEVKFYENYSAYESVLGKQVVIAEKVGNTLCVVPLENQ